MNFSEELINYMEILNCSSKELCQESGLSSTLISRYINNKRTPKENSEYLEKLINALYQIAQNKNINLSKETISKTLIQSLNSNNVDFNIFVDNLNQLQEKLSISTVDLSRAIGYDASFISRIKNKERKPADFSLFINKLREYVFSICQNNNKKEILTEILDCDIDDLKDNEIFNNWIASAHINNNLDYVGNFLSSLDNFNLNDYIGTDFDKVKVPTLPVILKNSKTYYGIEGRKQAEGEFLKTTLLSKSNEPIFFYSDLPISKTGEDEDFKKTWVLAMTMLLKKGLHLNIIHNIDRQINEMLLGLENWIPIYMTGSISPYYFKNPPSNFFLGSHCTSGSIALSSECLNNENKSRFYVTTKKEEVSYYKEKSKYLLTKSKPLMKIFKETDKTEFENFMNQEENRKFQKIKKDIFKNIDFYLHEDKWIMINKINTPEIHFVIYNDKLLNAIKLFLKS